MNTFLRFKPGFLSAKLLRSAVPKSCAPQTKPDPALLETAFGGWNRLKSGYRPGSLLVTLRRIIRLQPIRIIIRIDQDGFTADLISHRSKAIGSIIWLEGEGTWYPGAMLKRFEHAAQESCVDLEVPAAMVLSQRIKLPKAALSNLPGAVAYGLSSWSPFQAEDVYVRGIAQDVRQDQALVCLFYVLRERADAIINRLAETGFNVDRIILDPASKCLVPLPTPRMARISRARLIDGFLSVTATILLIALALAHVTTMSQRIEDLQVRLRTELDEHRRFETLKASYDSYIARRSAILERREKETSAYELLAALAQHLPEGALLQALEISKGRGRFEISNSSSERLSQGLRAIPFISSFKIEDDRASQHVVVTFESAGKWP